MKKNITLKTYSYFIFRIMVMYLNYVFVKSVDHFFSKKGNEVTFIVSRTLLKNKNFIYKIRDEKKWYLFNPSAIW